MKIAYLIDKDSLGGGGEYIRRKSDEQIAAGDECRTFYADRGECRAQKLDAWGADEIVVNHLKALLQLLGRPWERPQGRVRFVVHGIHLRGCHGMRYWLRRTLEAWLYHRCEEIVALTSNDKADILRLYGRDLHVVIEPNTLTGWKPRLIDGMPPGVTGEFKYVCIGRFNYQKGQDRWLKKLGKMKDAGIREIGRTLFIGDGETLDECKHLAAKLGISDVCVFAGAIADADRYLKCAEVVVSPSRWEGMPYLLMKARAIGCKILATDCPGNGDVLAGYERWGKLDLDAVASASVI